MNGYIYIYIQDMNYAGSTCICRVPKAMLKDGVVVGESFRHLFPLSSSVFLPGLLPFSLPFLRAPDLTASLFLPHSNAIQNALIAVAEVALRAID